MLGSLGFWYFILWCSFVIPIIVTWIIEYHREKKD